MPWTALKKFMQCIGLVCLLEEVIYYSGASSDRPSDGWESLSLPSRKHSRRPPIGRCSIRPNILTQEQTYWRRYQGQKAEIRIAKYLLVKNQSIIRKINALIGKITRITKAESAPHHRSNTILQHLEKSTPITLCMISVGFGWCIWQVNAQHNLRGLNNSTHPNNQTS